MAMTTQSNSSQSKSEPHPYIQGDLLGYLDGLRSWYGANQTAPPYQVAGASPAQESARSSMWGWGNAALNNLDSSFAPSLDALTATARGDNLDVGRNPYFQANLDNVNRRQNEVWADTVMPSINATFGGAGRTGGNNLHAANVGRSAMDLGGAQAAAGIGALSNLFNAGLDRQAAAASAIPGVLAQKSNIAGNWLGMLQGIGDRDTANTQRILDANRANFSVQPDFLTGMSQRTLGMFPGGQNLGSGTSMGWGDSGNGGGGLGSWLGTGMGLAGLALQAAPLFGFSDERLKDVEGRVGFTDEGLPLYLYTFKGDDEPRIGPMAQEIERAKPEAIVEHPSGFKMVDYRRAMPKGGLF